MLCRVDAYQCQAIYLCILNHYHIFAGSKICRAYSKEKPLPCRASILPSPHSPPSFSPEAQVSHATLLCSFAKAFLLFSLCHAVLLEKDFLQMWLKAKPFCALQYPSPLEPKQPADLQASCSFPMHLLCHFNPLKSLPFCKKRPEECQLEKPWWLFWVEFCFPCFRAGQRVG